MAQPPIKTFQLDTGAGAGALLARDSNALIPIEKNKLSTGILTGGQVSFGTLSGSPLTTTKVTVAAGTGGDLQEPNDGSDHDVVININGYGDITGQRLASTDVRWVVEETSPAD